MPRNTGLRLLPLLLIATLTAACSTTPDTPTIRVGIVCGGVGLAATAIDGGHVPPDVTAQKVCFDSGSDAVQALAGGSIDAFVGAGEHIVNNRAKGLDLKGYAVVSEQPPYSMVVPTPSPVRKVADLAPGATVAVTSPGSLSDTELQRAAADAGLAYDGLRVIGAGTGAAMQAAIEQGGAAAGMVTDPLLATMLRSGAFRVAWQPDFRYLALTVIARPDWVADNRPAMQGFLAGLREVQRLGAAEPDALLATVEKDSRGIGRDVLEPVLRGTLEQAPQGLTIDEGPYRDTVDLLTQVGQLEPGRAGSFTDAFDLSLLENR